MNAENRSQEPMATGGTPDDFRRTEAGRRRQTPQFEREDFEAFRLAAGVNQMPFKEFLVQACVEKVERTVREQIAKGIEPRRRLVEYLEIRRQKAGGRS